MFQLATRKKIRFESPQGNLTIEDLWEIPLTTNQKGIANVDDIAKSLFKQLKDNNNESFVIKNKPVDNTLQLKFDLIKHIIDVRLADAEIAATAKANKDKKQQLLAIIATKENEQLLGSSLEELRKMAESL